MEVLGWKSCWVVVILLSGLQSVCSICPQPQGLTPLSNFTIGEYRLLQPGGQTKCGDGTPFKFLVKRGSVNKIYFEMNGGGACWSLATCSGATDSLRVQEVFSLMDCESAIPAELKQSLGASSLMFDEYISTWHHVLVPYCTQDLHIGNKTTTYTSNGNSQVVHHRGAENFLSVARYFLENVPEPSVVVTAGCSAGSLGVTLTSTFLREAYAERSVFPRFAVFADSELGLITKAFTDDFLPSWGATCFYKLLAAPFFNLSDPDFWGANFTLEHVWDAGIKRTQTTPGPPALWFAYTTVSDAVQKRFYRLMGGSSSGFVARMVAFVQHLSLFPQVRVWADEGTTHCTLAGSVAMEKAGFREWILQGLDAMQSTAEPLPMNHICSSCTPSNSTGCDGEIGSQLTENSCGSCPGVDSPCNSTIPSWINNTCAEHTELQSLITASDDRLKWPLGCVERGHTMPLRVLRQSGLRVADKGVCGA